MRILIPCAGRATRWADDTNKHLVKLCGEPVLHRTVRLIAEIDPSAEVLIVCENHLDTDYKIDGSARRKARLGTGDGDIDKIASSMHLWDTNERTLIVFGDVWWSRPALELVLGGDASRSADWWTFGRISGRGGEIFGFDFGPDDHQAVTAACADISDRADELATAGYNGRPLRGGWALYRTLTGARDHGDHGHFVTVDDWTEDMDSRRDWDRWCLRYAKATEAQRAGQV